MNTHTIRPYVYYDERYPSHWIKPDVARHIAKTLENMGFKVVNADEVKKLMERAIATAQISEEIVIVFSQDVVPEILVDNPSSPTANSLIRRFLNNGHSIVWIGDIPLLHIGFSNGEKRTLTNAVTQQVLGLNPDVPHVSVPVRHTHLGHMFQLPIWIGTRPHKGRAPNVTGVSFIPLSLSRQGAHAFIATYYRGPVGNAFSGFIRLYDTVLDKPEKLSEDMIRGIVNVVFRNPVLHVWTAIQELQKRVQSMEEDLRTSFNTLKSELDNLSKILEKILKLIEKEKEAKSNS
ncbi:MAG: hypothetical protein B6U94_06050 [Thermofilum sp. ex4484_79]|nr:MAG: hypothetical protein B6U94_06050 [Thermofilum sp. ex4484_79]